MLSSKLQVFIYLSARPGNATELKLVLLEFLRRRCQEIGCRKCFILQDSIIQEDFILVEEWETQHRLESDLMSDYIVDFFQEGERLLAEEPSLRWFHVFES